MPFWIFSLEKYLNDFILIYLRRKLFWEVDEISVHLIQEFYSLLNTYVWTQKAEPPHVILLDPDGLPRNLF
jgi:hypothetical protein